MFIGFFLLPVRLAWQFFATFKKFIYKPNLGSNKRHRRNFDKNFTNNSDFSNSQLKHY